MARKKKSGTVQQVTDAGQVDSTMATYGLSLGLPTDKIDIEGEPSAESGAEVKRPVAAKSETKPAESLAETAHEEPENLEDEEEDQGEVRTGPEAEDRELATVKKELKAVNKAKEAAETQMRKLQSQVDQFDAQMRKFWNELQQRNQPPQPKAETTPGFDGHKDDDLVTLGELKNVISHYAKQADEKRQVASQDDAKKSWVARHPQYKSVVEFIQKNKLDTDPEFSGIPTDMVGYYFAAHAKMQGEEIARLGKEVESLKKRIPQPKPPPTGPIGAPAYGNSGRMPGGNAGLLERSFMDFATRRGFKPIVSER